MCGGGGGGGSASQDALAAEQKLQSQRNNAQRQNEDWERQKAIAQINQLYGTSSTINGVSSKEETHLIQDPVALQQRSFILSAGDKGNGLTPSATERAAAIPVNMIKSTPTFADKNESMTYDATDQAKARQVGYDNVRQNALAVALDSLSKQKEVAGRDIRFNVARSGLTGGSVDVDQNQALANKYSDGVIQANSGADGVVNNVRSRDESTRADLISRINAGMDANSATQSALSQMQNNQAVAKVDGQSNLLSNFFGAIGQGIGGYNYGAATQPGYQSNTSSYRAASSNGTLT